MPPALSINPGVARASDWTEIAYKGGSNAGVLNLTTLVTGKDGSQHCVSATWNGDSPLDEPKLMAPYRGILRALAASAGE